MDEFEALLEECRGAVERFVFYRTPDRADAEDIIQETCLTAFRRFDEIKDRRAFKGWILRIAVNKCNDYFRARFKALEIPLDSYLEKRLTNGRSGVVETEAVRDTLSALSGNDRQILYLFFFRQLPQAEIARRLGIPLGTVKSRLHTAKTNFKREYPFTPKGVHMKKTLPEFLPEYTITPSAQPPFSVVWQEMMGWFIVPRAGEKLSWGMYDMPSRKGDCRYDMEVVGRAEVHGVEGVEVIAKETPFSGKASTTERAFIAQLTDAYCRCLAAISHEDGVKKIITFLDADEFMPIWGFGENNCGNETHLSAKGDIAREGHIVTAKDQPFLADLVGRYDVSIHGKTHDTVCLMILESGDDGALIEQYLNRDGRTVLWRRFNRDDWAIDRYKKPWSEQLPDNERLIVNGKTYVHWYDCVTDSILS